MLYPPHTRILVSQFGESGHVDLRSEKPRSKPESTLNIHWGKAGFNQIAVDGSASAGVVTGQAQAESVELLLRESWKRPVLGDSAYLHCSHNAVFV
jgi:hypothetical protein